MAELWDHPAVRGHHLVSMTVDHRMRQHVGVCRCGWIGRRPFPGGYWQLDDDIAAHWRVVIAEAERVPT